VTIVDVTLIIACDAASAPAVLGQLAPWSPEPAPAGGAHMQVTSAPDDEESFVLGEPGSEARTVRGTSACRLALQDWLDITLATRARHLVPVHAGVVAVGDTALLLPASSGSGKTTLVTALVTQGATYLSDEIAFIDDTGHVHAYPRLRVERDAGGARHAVSTLDARVRLGPARAVHVIHLTYTSGATLSVQPITAGEALLLLLAHTARPVDPTVGPPRGLVNAVRSAESARGVRGEASDAASALLHLMRSGRC